MTEATAGVGVAGEGVAALGESVAEGVAVDPACWLMKAASRAWLRESNSDHA